MQSVVVRLRVRAHANRLTELADVHDIVLILQNSSLVVVYIKVVGRAENGHDTGKASRPSLPVHSVSSVLSLVRTDD